MKVPKAPVIMALASATLIHESAISTEERLDALSGFDQASFVPESWQMEVVLAVTTTDPD